jgi:hypothetical protein
MWIDSGTVNEGELRVLNTNNEFKAHYKNIIVDNFESVAPTEVSVVLYNGGQEIIRFVFNSTGSTKTSWFSKTNLISSPYTDIDSEPHNFFSILGDQRQLPTFNVDRNFFISKNYDGCPGDNGWLVVICGTDYCDWGRRGQVITILYGTRPTVTTWSEDFSTGEADVMAVFLR